MTRQRRSPQVRGFVRLGFMRSGLFDRKGAIAAWTGLFLLLGIACVLFFSPRTETVVPAVLRLPDEVIRQRGDPLYQQPPLPMPRSDEVSCEFPAVLRQLPAAFGFISWRYTIRTSYRFPSESPMTLRSLQLTPPPTVMVMVPIKIEGGRKTVVFDSAEGVLEPYVMNVCLRPLVRKWKFKFPEKLPRVTSFEDALKE